MVINKRMIKGNVENVDLFIGIKKEIGFFLVSGFFNTVLLLCTNILTSAVYVCFSGLLVWLSLCAGTLQFAALVEIHYGKAKRSGCHRAEEAFGGRWGRSGRTKGGVTNVT